MHPLSKFTLCLAAGLAFSVCQKTHAQGLTVGVHLASVHIPAHDDQNNRNLGAYVRSVDGWTLGGYRNTIRRNSLYAGKTERGLLGPVDVTAGIVSGYQKKDGKGHTRGALGPLLAFSYQVPVAVLGVKPRIVYVPGHLVKAADLVHLAVEF
jgi:hypothetical protein